MGQIEYHLPTDSAPGKLVVVDTKPELTERQLKRYHKQQRKDSIRANKNLWLSILGGPSYTPEASVGVGGAMLASFRINKSDTISQRSFLPIGFNLSLNGTIVVAGAGTFFFKENRFRIYTNYGFRNEPSNYFGKGYDNIEQVELGDSTTLFKKTSFQLYPRFVWELKPHFYVGGLFDLNYSKSFNINPLMAEDAYFNKFNPEYLNVGIGGLVQYDTRDDVATPTKGVLLSVNGRVFGKYLGGAYNYEQLELEYRHFQPVFRPRSTLGWIVKSQMSFGDVPFTELPSFGSPFDLRGYYWGKYRDKSMAYSIVEYRHMFGSHADYRNGSFLAKLGFVAWGGAGSLSNVPFNWNKWKFNYGVGLRIQMQPGKNFRLDVGKEPGQGMLFYMNMTEAF
jgi:outer membrane protein assembly factor BamA